ncbi:MAG: PhaM family polyhydroxyalkanoate granule multifunctional regulatory protein [Usitatibacter sp.]
MSKPVTPQEMFDLWQKMVNPSAYPLQSLMFPVLDPKELEKKIAELEAVEHWLKANLNMLQLTIKSLQYQRAMLKGGEKFAQSLADQEERKEAGESEIPNPSLWAWSMMADAAKTASPQPPPGPAPRAPKKKKRS